MTDRAITLKIWYGPGRRFMTAKEVLEFHEGDWAIASHDDPFEQRDTLQRALLMLKPYVGDIKPVLPPPPIPDPGCGKPLKNP